MTCTHRETHTHRRTHNQHGTNVSILHWTHDRVRRRWLHIRAFLHKQRALLLVRDRARVMLLRASATCVCVRVCVCACVYNAAPTIRYLYKTCDAMIGRQVIVFRVYTKHPQLQ